MPVSALLPCTRQRFPLNLYTKHNQSVQYAQPGQWAVSPPRMSPHLTDVQSIPQIVANHHYRLLKQWLSFSPARLREGHRGSSSFSYGGLKPESGFKELRQTWTWQSVHSDHPSESSTTALAHTVNLPEWITQYSATDIWGECVIKLQFQSRELNLILCICSLKNKRWLLCIPKRK